ncbi:hypothetical protein ACJX0J_029478, partial [Zea mays]
MIIIVLMYPSPSHVAASSPPHLDHHISHLIIKNIVMPSCQDTSGDITYEGRSIGDIIMTLPPQILKRVLLIGVGIVVLETDAAVLAEALFKKTKDNLIDISHSTISLGQ